jgi:hypothetical protein
VGKQRFEIKLEHLKLIRRMNVGWQDCEYGAPEIDPKRPYGDSDVEDDILEILGWKKGPKIIVDGVEYELNEDDWEIPEELSDKLRKLHKETQTALQICLCTGAFKPGRYEAAEYSFDDWKRVES